MPETIAHIIEKYGDFDDVIEEGTLQEKEMVTNFLFDDIDRRQAAQIAK